MEYVKPLNESIHKYTEVHRSIQKYSEVYRNIKKYTEVYISIQKYTDVFRSSYSNHAPHKWHLPGTNLCVSLPTISHIFNSLHLLQFVFLVLMVGHFDKQYQHSRHYPPHNHYKYTCQLNINAISLIDLNDKNLINIIFD